MEQKANNIVTKFATPSMLFTLAGAIIWLIVEVKKIPTIEQRLDKKIALQNEMHDNIDILKIRITQELYEVQLKIKDEKIERLQSEIENLKSK